MIGPAAAGDHPGEHSTRETHEGEGTFRRISASSWSGSSLAKGPVVPKPALLTSSSRALSPAARSSTVRNAMEWVRSRHYHLYGNPVTLSQTPGESFEALATPGHDGQIVLLPRQGCGKDSPQAGRSPGHESTTPPRSCTVAVCAMSTPPQAFPKTSLLPCMRRSVEYVRTSLMVQE